jgi:hypothetical protein
MRSSFFLSALFLYTEMYNLLFGGQENPQKERKNRVGLAPDDKNSVQDFARFRFFSSLSLLINNTKREKGAASFF